LIFSIYNSAVTVPDGKIPGSLCEWMGVVSGAAIFACYDWIAHHARNHSSRAIAVRRGKYASLSLLRVKLLFRYKDQQSLRVTPFCNLRSSCKHSVYLYRCLRVYHFGGFCWETTWPVVAVGTGSGWSDIKW